MSRLPNFFIVGAAKSGTSSLADYLGQHPQVYMSPVKEPYYFVPGFGVETLAEYGQLFEKANTAVAIGEASTGYLYSEAAAQGIKDQIPEARILIILRHPVDMAFSLWSFMRRQGNESAAFEEAIHDSPVRQTAEFRMACVGWPDNYLYLERAQYYPQVKRYVELFGPERVKVLIFEEFFEAAEIYCREVFRFLNVSETFVPQIRVVNPGGMTRFKFLKWLAWQRYPWLRAILPFTLRVKIRAFIREINVKKGERSILSAATRRQLWPLFAADIKQLEALLGRSLWPE